MEGIGRCPAVRCRIRQRLNDLHLLDDRARPAMRDDHRQRIFMLGTHVNEMNVEPVDLSNEIRQRIDLRFALAPIVFVRPILRELLHRRHLYALRRIVHLSAIRPLCRGDPFAQVGEVRFGNVYAERTDCMNFG